MNDKLETRKMEFVFARIHFEGLFSNDAKENIKNFLLKSEEKFIDEGKFRWAFGDIDSQNINDNDIIFGRLGRTVTKKFETIYDQENHSYKKELVRSNEAAYSNFFIVPHYNVLAFEDKYNLSKGKFIKKFMEFWLKTETAEISFEFVKNEIEIFEILKSWDRLTKATFKLVPSNPSSRDAWKPVDLMIQKSKAERAKLEFENKKDSLAKDDSIIQQSVSMASDGYGEFKLKGFKDNVGQNLSSISRIMKKEIHNVDDLKAIVVQIYEEIKKITKNKNHYE